MKWSAITGKENLTESDEDYTILCDVRFTPPRFVSFKRQYGKLVRVKLSEGEKKTKPDPKVPPPKPKWAPPIVIGGFDSREAAEAACEKHSQESRVA